MDIRIKILLIIIVLLYGVKAVSEAEHSTDGIELYQLQSETVHYQVLNGELQEQVATAQSLGYIDNIARHSMGFVDSKSINL